MLVLTRKVNEKIVIGNGEDAVEIVVIQIRPDRVRIGINARPEVWTKGEEMPPQTGGATSCQPLQGASNAQPLE